MVAEPWITKMGNQVSTNLKHVLYLDNLSKSSKKQGPQEKQIIGIISFEVANVMSKIVTLHKSLSENETLKLKDEIFNSEGIKTLVLSDERQLFELALVEKLDELNRIASVVARLGKKCTIPALQGFEHVYGDVVSGVIGVGELGFLVKDMEGMVRRMERYVNCTVSLYSEMEAMSDLEVSAKKSQHGESKKVYEQKLAWRRQDVRHLKDVSLWNQTYDKVVEILARTVCTVYARIFVVFGEDGRLRDVCDVSVSRSQFGFSGHVKQEQGQKGQLEKSVSAKGSSYHHSGPIKSRVSKPKLGLQKREGGGMFGPEDFNFACGVGPGRMFMECLSMSSSASKVDDGDDDDGPGSCDDQTSQISSCYSVANGAKSEAPSLLSRFVGPVSPNGDQIQSKGYLVNCARTKSRLLAYASPSTVGGSALALHYANVIIVLEKLLRYPHLVGDEARDELYYMLPTSLRKTLKAKLRSYVKDVAIYDAPLAHDWRERLNTMLKWLAPLAHNMVRWQSERNFEQHQIVTRTNVLLLETLYFADREKTEEAICEVLVGLNYICRYEQQQNALLDCASSFDLEDCTEWQSQFHASYH